MNNKRQTVLSIAGFDPSAGAGILADIKTFEACGVYGVGGVSALTYQNDIAFEKVEWMSFSQITEQIEILKKRFQFKYIKIGLIKDLDLLLQLVTYLKGDYQIIWDPILNASAGYDFHQEIQHEKIKSICKMIYLITPNTEEILKLGEHNNAFDNAKKLSAYCNVYLKGGHNEENRGLDILFTHEGNKLEFKATEIIQTPKHGSGCVLSSAITANLSLGKPLKNACADSKNYIHYFLSSNDSLLGYHSNNPIIQHA